MKRDEAQDLFEKYLKNVNSQLEEEKAEREKRLTQENKEGFFEPNKTTYIELKFHVEARKASVLCMLIQYLDESNIEAVNKIVNTIRLHTDEKLK